MTRPALLLAACALPLAACAPPREAPEDWRAWYDSGAALDVEEPVTFIEGACYGFPEAPDQGIAAFLDQHFPVDGTAFEEGASIPPGCDFGRDPELPVDIEGVVTLHPRFYFKTSGCTPASDEKYYGSTFIADDHGGVFVLGDSKVAHYDVGDRVRLRVRAVRTNFGLDLVYAHDVLEVERLGGPVCFRRAEGPLGDADVGEVVRVEGEVVAEADTFGEITVEADDGTRYTVGLDAELNRRGVAAPQGSRLVATGPVLLSYSAYKVVIMRIGQLELNP